MKKITLLILVAMFSIQAFANYTNTRLVVSTTANQNYILLIDGYTVSDKYKNGSSYYINDINSANHRIQLYKQSNSIFGGNNRKLVYDNSLFLKANTETIISLNILGNVTINEQPLGNSGNNTGDWNGSGNTPNTNNDGWNGCNNANSNNSNHKGHKCEGKKGKGHRKHKHNDDCDGDNSWNNNNNNGNWNNGNGGWNDKVEINDKAFYQLKQSIQNESFDDTKQSIALQALRNNYFTSSQIKELVQLFSFESSKLGIAKQAYKNTIDKQNYFVVTDAFSFSSSKQELIQYTHTVV